MLVCRRRDAKTACRFFEQAIGATKVTPVEATTDEAKVYPAVLEGLLPAAWHRTPPPPTTGPRPTTAG